MSTKAERPRELLLLRLIESVWDTASTARQEHDIRTLCNALEDLYRLHGRPFGPERRGMVLWLEYGKATTVN